MKKIIIALDYEPAAEKVADEGYALAKKLGAEVMLLHVVAEPAYYSNLEYSPVMGFAGFGGPDILEAEINLKEEAQRFLINSRSHLGDESINTSVVEGDFSEAILDAIKEFDADLLVMGTHSRRGFEKLLVGNLAAKMLNVITIPLLAIPTN
ncbi:MAG: universal stress protein [Ferruginibacter sp.]